MPPKNFRPLVAAGFAISIGLPALAEENLDNALPPNTPAEHMNVPQERRADNPPEEARERWQAMSPEDRAERRKAMREHWEKMPPEERREMRKKMKEHWMKMPPEEREARRKAMREHWERMSPEERAQFRRDMGEPDKR